VPRPRLHLIRFHGVLAPNAKLRPLVVPQGPQVQEADTEAAAPAECEVETAQARPYRISWARLLKRVFAIDMRTCSNCGGGELMIIAAILERPVIEKFLTHPGAGPAATASGTGARGRARLTPPEPRWPTSTPHPQAVQHRNAAGATLRAEWARRCRIRVKPEFRPGDQGRCSPARFVKAGRIGTGPRLNRLSTAGFKSSWLALALH
jgi:hypothetical protein